MTPKQGFHLGRTLGGLREAVNRQDASLAKAFAEDVKEHLEKWSANAHSTQVTTHVEEILDLIESQDYKLGQEDWEYIDQQHQHIVETVDNYLAH